MARLAPRPVEAVLDRFRSLDDRLRAAVLIGLVVLAYVALATIPGTKDFVRDKAPIGIVVVGIIFGTVTSLLAMGLILVYRTNRFINFAYGSMGSLVGVIFVGLHLRHGWSYFLILPLGVLVGVAVGALTEFLAIRRFRHSSRLILTVASIGLAQLMGGLELLGSQAIDFVSLASQFQVPGGFEFQFDVVTIGSDQLLIVAVVPLIVAGLAWFLLKTDAGIAVRAAAENEDRALLLGIPIRRLSTIVWMIAGGLATLTFILKAPFTGVVPGVAANGPTVLLPGLAAAVVARMESLPVAFGAGIALGIMEQVVRWNTSGTPSFQNVVFLVVIIGALLLQRGTLSRAKLGGTSSWSGSGVVKPIPRELRGLREVRVAKGVLLVLVGVLAVWVPSGWSASSQLLAAFAIVWAMVGVSLVVLTGWGGHISLGQFAIVGVGAVVGGNLVGRANIDLFLALIAAGVAGGVVALVVGLPALRIQGLFLAVTTMAFAIALNSYFFNPDQFGEFLPTSITRPFLWQRFDLEENYVSYLLCLAFLGLAILASLGVRRTRSGRVVVAARDNQRAADAAAVPTTSVKLSAFLLSGVIAGVGGGLHVLLLHSLGGNAYSPVDSLTVFSTAVIGGLGSVTGAITGVLVFRYLETITALGELRLLITGTGLLVVLYALPGGFGQVLFGVRDRYLRWVAERHDILVPSLVADRRQDGDDDRPPEETSLLEGALSDEPRDRADDRQPEPVGD